MLLNRVCNRDYGCCSRLGVSLSFLLCLIVGQYLLLQRTDQHLKALTFETTLGAFIPQVVPPSRADRQRLPHNNLHLPDLSNHDNAAAARNNETKSTTSNSTTTTVPNRVYYVGKFGLGHRLSKLSAAHHLATHILNVSEVEVHWGSCKTGTTDLFTFLFGTHVLPAAATTAATATSGKMILVRNDVHGYYAGQNYKNAQRVIPKRYASDNNSDNSGPWVQKLQADEILFRDLRHRFMQRHSQVRAFMKQQDWHNRTLVVGLHLRGGNGELHHFATSGRAVNDTTRLVQDLCQLLVQSLVVPIAAAAAGIGQLPRLPLLFLATDTKDLIPIVRHACGSSFETVVLPQPRLDVGVSYAAWTQGEECFTGWKASMMDMVLLASSDILVAGMRSTFTQILPLALVLSDNDKKEQSSSSLGRIRRRQYCEVAPTGRSMTCFDNKRAWLFRNNPARQQYTYSLETASTKSILPPALVVHKTLVHLPDLELSPLTIDAIAFVQDIDTNKTVFVYGKHTIDTKYRNTMNQSFREEWTWED
jgi:hypothetical protein